MAKTSRIRDLSQIQLQHRFGIIFRRNGSDSSYGVFPLSAVTRKQAKVYYKYFKNSDRWVECRLVNLQRRLCRE